jgi:hypothetical protein
VESTFVWDSTLQTRLARGYGMYNDVIPNYRYIEDAAGGLYSTPKEMAQYAQVLINGSSVLSEKAFEQLFEGDTYGFGHGLIDFPSGQRMIFGGGTRMGWQSDFVVIPEDGCGIVVLANANGGVILDLILIDLWVQYKTGYAWPGAAIYLYEYPALIAVGVILGALCLVLAWRVFSQFTRGQRSFLFRQSRKLKWLRIVCSFFVIGGVLGLWLMAVTPYIDHQQRLLWLPEPALYVGIAGTVLSALICTGLLFPKNKRDYA